MNFHRIDIRHRKDHTEVAARYPVSPRPKKPALQKALAKELRRLADLLEREKWEEGGTATGVETEARSLLLGKETT